jgi:hypothetical protein
MSAGYADVLADPSESLNSQIRTLALQQISELLFWSGLGGDRLRWVRFAKEAQRERPSTAPINRRAWSMRPGGPPASI